MKIAIIGGRDFNDYELLKKTLSPYLNVVQKIISGGAKGADSLAEKFVEENNLEKLIFHADWNDMSEPCKIKYNKKGDPYNALAGFKRNQKIIENSDLVIAFWDSKSPGTRDSIGKANKIKTPTLIVYY